MKNQKTQWGEAQQFLEAAFEYEGDKCLIWPYRRNDQGYAQIFHGSQCRYVSRIVCSKARGPAPSRKHDAAHSCGRGHLGCVAKAHLRWATRKANCVDKIAHGTSNGGAKNGRAKLTLSNVIEIRSRRGVEARSSLASRFNVNPSTISRIQLGQRWH